MSTSRTDVGPLWLPYYDAPFAAASKRFWLKYATFSGRAGRAEYWWSYLMVNLISIGANILVTIVAGATGSLAVSDSESTTVSIPSLIGSGVIFLFLLATLIPNLAVSVRRLHDTNRSGGWIFIGLIPFVGAIILIVLLILAPDPAGIRFDDPTAQPQVPAPENA